MKFIIFQLDFDLFWFMISREFYPAFTSLKNLRDFCLPQHNTIETVCKQKVAFLFCPGILKLFWTFVL